MRAAVFVDRTDPNLQAQRRDIALLKIPKLIAEKTDPKRVKERTDREDPSAAPPITEIVKQLPAATRPRALNDEPTFVKLLKDKIDPMEAKCSVETDNPTLTNERKEIDDPKLRPLITLHAPLVCSVVVHDKLLPSLAIPLIDMLDPVVVSDCIDIQQPNRPPFLTDSADPI
jgi:hypothetical protein